eukprot:m.46782 g.46782  ORF g.46782 m.46782 type:complete len:83 (-) comp17558_c0_seq3:60-308(-)
MLELAIWLAGVFSVFLAGFVAGVYSKRSKTSKPVADKVETNQEKEPESKVSGDDLPDALLTHEVCFRCNSSQAPALQPTNAA